MPSADHIETSSTTTKSAHAALTQTWIGARYDRMTSNFTRIVAAEMVDSVYPPITSSSNILDSSCGPGIVSEQIKLKYPDARITATDFTPTMIEEVQHRIKVRGWSNMQTHILDGNHLSTVPSDSITHAFTNFGMLNPADLGNSVPMVKELFRVLKVGGVAMMSNFADRVFPLAFLDTARIIRPNEVPTDKTALAAEYLRGSWMMAALEDGGFGSNVEVRPCQTYMMAPSLDELLDNMMLGSSLFFPNYSDEELTQAKAVLREELQKLRTYEVSDEGVRIGIKAWIGIGWKKGDEGEKAY